MPDWVDTLIATTQETSWLAFGSSAFIKGTLVLALAWIATKALTKSPAAVRHWIWTLSLLGLLALPPASLVLPAWPLPISTSFATREAPESRQPFLETWSFDKASTRRAQSRPRENVATTVPALAPVEPGGLPGSWPWPSVAAFAWLAGIALLLSRLLYGHWRTGLEIRRSQRVNDPSWIGLLDELTGRLGLPDRVPLLRAQRSVVPITYGIVRRHILLPFDADRWSEDRRRRVLIHELAHVERRDCMTQILAQLVCAVYWWNPLAWHAAKQLRQESERACDDRVLNNGARASDYAHDLLEMVRALHAARPSVLYSVALAHRSRFEDRLLAILEPNLARCALGRARALAAALVAGALFLPLAPLQPWARAQDIPPRVVSSRELPSDSPAPEPVEPNPVSSEGPTEDEQAASVSPAPAAEPQEPNEGTAPEPEESEKEEEESFLVNERAAAALMEALNDPEPSVRAMAVDSLGNLQYRPAVELLLGALNDQDAEVRENTARALGMIGDERAVQPLVATLNDPEADVREQTAWALGMIQDEGALGALVAALRDEDPDVREQVAWACGMIDDPRAIDALSGALQDEDSDVREQAAWALGRVAKEGREREP